MTKDTSVDMVSIVTPLRPIDRPLYPRRASAIFGGIIAALVIVTIGNTKIAEWKAERTAAEQQRQWQEVEAQRQAQYERQRQELEERQRQIEAQRNEFAKQQEAERQEFAKQQQEAQQRELEKRASQSPFQSTLQPSDTTQRAQNAAPVQAHPVPKIDIERQRRDADERQRLANERAQREFAKAQADTEAKMKAEQQAMQQPATQPAEKLKEGDGRSVFKFSLGDFFKKGE